MGNTYIEIDLEENSAFSQRVLLNQLKERNLLNLF